jgi:hypothetical protein
MWGMWVCYLVGMLLHVMAYGGYEMAFAEEPPKKSPPPRLPFFLSPF